MLLSRWSEHDRVLNNLSATIHAPPLLLFIKTGRDVVDLVSRPVKLDQQFVLGQSGRRLFIPDVKAVVLSTCEEVSLRCRGAVHVLGQLELQIRQNSTSVEPHVSTSTGLAFSPQGGELRRVNDSQSRIADELRSDSEAV
jgi:hypothetical protein